MMGKQKGRQPKLFYSDINIEDRVPQKHILRKINKVIDFDFIYREVSDRYGMNGNVSVPPPVILKLMLLLVLYNQRSER
jgi:transposase